MFRRVAVIAVTAMMLAACSMPFGERSPSAPAARPAAAPAERTVQTESAPGSPLLDPQSTAAACPASCERSYRVCMDSVAARPNSSEPFGAQARPFTDTENCQNDLGRCLRRCSTAPAP
ncbi:hypothetical protein [Azospirillum halopraeferens]|uniref:hypothetical protein n=1 Tax=Azospirillum halopraeferens TaxID=34010 RepID=UPI00041FE0D6|nr:hypothetical protein [Azospirillum halopraeferens]